MLSGGKSIRRGRGGVTRRISQITGSAASAVSTSGAAKVRGRPSIVSRQIRHDVGVAAARRRARG